MSWENEDRRLIKAAAEELEDYIESQQLLWPLANSAGLLSPGNLMLGLKRIEVVESILTNLDDQSAISKIAETIERRQSAWNKKIMNEIPFRIRLWKNSLEEYLEEGLIDLSFAAQVKNRVLCELLIDEVRSLPPAIEAEINAEDNQLKRISRPGAFVWDQRLAKVFEQEKFWFLYIKKNTVTQ